MKLTEWYKGDQKPARVGVYERDYGACFVYSRWDGNRWFVYADCIELALQQRLISDSQSLPWRGIAK
jgi:hypothetical protein